MSVINKPSFFPMHNIIQNYAWGSKTSLNELFNIPNPEQQHQAEIWMGAHPNGCSNVDWESKRIKLSELIATNKPAFLSQRTADEFGELPYLFKVLAANQALSVQVHPSKQEAEIGFEKENQAGIPLNSPQRNYKDANHKPELVYALTHYQAMNGFRGVKDILNYFSALKSTTLSPLIERLSTNQTPSDLKEFFISLLSLTGSEKEFAIQDLLRHAEKSHDNINQLILELNTNYPGDIGLFTPLLLNVITLEPGEAMYLDARTPHAYLKGTGLEVMANSDNVLRAGLTPKHMDVLELASCTSFKEKPFNTLKLEPTVHKFGEQRYSIPVHDFKFSLYLTPDQAVVEPQSSEILMAIDDEVILTTRDEQSIVEKGQSIFIPAYVKSYKMCSKGRVARVYN